MDSLFEIYKSTLTQMYGSSKTEEEIVKLVKEKMQPFPAKENLKRTVVLSYYNGMVNDKDVISFEDQLANFDFQLFKKDYSADIYNSSYDLAEEVVLFLGSEVTGGVLLGALGSGLWTIVIDFVKSLRTKIKGTKLNILSGDKVKNQVEVSLTLIVQLNDSETYGFDLNNGLTEDNIDEAVEKVRHLLSKPTELQKVEIKNTKKRYRYSHSTKDWELVKKVKA